MYDVIIIGGGASGSTASLYSARRGLKTLVLTRDIGGQASKTDSVENYPGYPSPINGFELMNNFKKQAERFGAEFKIAEVEKIEKKAQNNFEVFTPNNNYQAKTIILALGLSPRKLNVPGEKEFLNRGVAYCATCDAPLFQNKITLVVGGGNSALGAALLLASIGKKVFILVRENKFIGEKILIDKVKNNPKIEILFDSEVVEIKGTNFVEKIKILNNKTNLEKIIEADGIFVEIGWIADGSLVQNLVELDYRKQIKINLKNETSQKGIFACGDCTNVPYKQIIIAAGEGAKAALSCHEYLEKTT
jgi:thioredoxin reductase (NADPH)